MSEAFKCTRCGSFSTTMCDRHRYNSSGGVAYLIFKASDRQDFDLCHNCYLDLRHVIKEWWHGLAPK